MRAMHDSSSSWTDRSLPPRPKAASKQQAAGTISSAAACPAPLEEHLKPICQDVLVSEAALKSSIVALDATKAAEEAATEAAAEAVEAETGLSTYFARVCFICMSVSGQQMLATLGCFCYCLRRNKHALEGLVKHLVTNNLLSTIAAPLTCIAPSAAVNDSVCVNPAYVMSHLDMQYCKMTAIQLLHAFICVADCDQLRRSGAQLQPAAAATAATAADTAEAAQAHAKAAAHAGARAAAANEPKQTLEEMAAWLDAQLAAAPGNCLFPAGHMHCVSSALQYAPEDIIAACLACADRTCEHFQCACSSEHNNAV